MGNCCYVESKQSGSENQCEISNNDTKKINSLRHSKLGSRHGTTKKKLSLNEPQSCVSDNAKIKELDRSKIDASATMTTCNFEIDKYANSASQSDCNIVTQSSYSKTGTIKREGTESYQKKSTRVFDNSKFVNMKSSSLFDDYAVCDKLGEGAYGFVYKTMHKATKQYLAVKAIKKTSIDESSFYNETNILKSVDHPNIIRLYETYSDSGFYYMVEEYCAGGDLYDYIKSQKNLSEKKVAIIISQIVLAVNHLHSKNIVHRDLKPENIVFVDTESTSVQNHGSSAERKYKSKTTSILKKKGNRSIAYNTELEDIHIKLIDFGASTYLKEMKLTQELGTIYYIAPEVFRNNYDEKCDIWSCGIILYTMLCGHPPFRGSNEVEIKNKILNHSKFDFQEKEWRRASQPAKDLVLRMLNCNPQFRPNALEVLNSHWIKSNLQNQVKDHYLDLTIINNLIKFHASLVLQKAVLSYLTNQMDNSDLKVIKEEFDKIDLNKDGVISREELAFCLTSIYPQQEIQSKVEEIFSQVDFNEDNTISFSEFVTVSAQKEKVLTRDMLRKAFDIFDLDGNGFITKDELDKTLPATIKDDNTWEELIHEVDKDGDGRINFEEFVNMMELYLKQLT